MAQLLARLGKYHSINLDARAKDRLLWAGRACFHLYGIEASPSVLLRCALAVYVDNLECQMREPISGMDRRCGATAMRVAGRGVEVALPSAQLEAMPPRPFSEIASRAWNDGATARRESMRAFLAGSPGASE
jgi:hypothetical protein